MGMTVVGVGSGGYKCERPPLFAKGHCPAINTFVKTVRNLQEDSEDVRPKSCSRPAGFSSHRSDDCIERNASLKFYSPSMCCKAHLSPDSFGIPCLLTCYAANMSAARPGCERLRHVEYNVYLHEPSLQLQRQPVRGRYLHAR